MKLCKHAAVLFGLTQPIITHKQRASAADCSRGVAWDAKPSMFNFVSLTEEAISGSIQILCK
jgi:hypothetical protein